MREPYLRLPNRSNTRKRLEMVVGQSVSHSTPSKTVAEVLASEGSVNLALTIEPKIRGNAPR
jgi:hypothetical protein